MLGDLLPVEPTSLCVTGRLIHLNDAMLQVYVKKAVKSRIRRPLDQARLRPIHGELNEGRGRLLCHLGIAGTLESGWFVRSVIDTWIRSQFH